LNFLYTSKFSLYDEDEVLSTLPFKTKEVINMDNAKKQLILSKKEDGP
jgi:hypothetical protein